MIYHASYMDEETMDALEKNKHKHIVVPTLNWLYATLYETAPFGFNFSESEENGYKRELDSAIKGCKEMRQRGITVLPYAFYTYHILSSRKLLTSSLMIEGVTTVLPGRLMEPTRETWSTS